MEKGDKKLIIIFIIILVILALLVFNLDLLFPTPTVQETISQVAPK